MSPLNAKGAQIMRSMKKTYGSDEKAKRVFYSSVNAGKISGVDKSRRKPKRGSGR